MNKLPFVTIIIPYKNNLDYLFIALKSIFNQSYKNFKILIVYDDEDKSDLSKIKKFLKSTATKRNILFKIIVNKNSLGAGYARNVGIKKSKSKYLAFLDSDDIWAKNKLKTQVNYMEKNNILFSHTSYHIINTNNKIISSRSARKKIIFQDLIKSCDIGLSTVILKSSLLRKNKLLFPKIKTKEDYVLWLKISKKEKIIGLNKILTSWRKTNDSLSSSIFQKIIDGYRVYLNYEKFTIIQSIFMVCRLSFFYLIKVTKNN